MLSITNTFMFKWVQSWIVNACLCLRIKIQIMQLESMWPQVKPTQNVFFIQCLTIWVRLFNSVHDHKRTVTALTTIHRHNRRASHKILEWWSWYKGGTKRRQNLCALVAEFGRMKSDVHVWVILNVKGRNSPSSLLLTYLLICSREQPEDELHCGNGGSVTKPWPNGAFSACGYTFRKHPQNRSMKTSLISNTFSF